MEPEDEELLRELRSFAESREVAKRDESEARTEQCGISSMRKCEQPMGRLLNYARTSVSVWKI
jgi:hypothetical protein